MTREVLIEVKRYGHLVQVHAVDPVTLTEVSVQGPASAGLEMLRRHAITRLNYVLSRKGASGR